MNINRYLWKYDEKMDKDYGRQGKGGTTGNHRNGRPWEENVNMHETSRYNIFFHPKPPIPTISSRSNLPFPLLNFASYINSTLQHELLW